MTQITFGFESGTDEDKLTTTNGPQESIAVVSLRRELESARRQLDAAKAVHAHEVRDANRKIERAAMTVSVYADAVEEYERAIARLAPAYRQEPPFGGSLRA